jgi:hypothetical protein
MWTLQRLRMCAPALACKCNNRISALFQDFFGRYFAMVRLELQPLLTPPAEALLSTYYQQQRQAVDRSAARTTIRMLESAIRLSQAHARLCFRSSVVVLDACVAISLLEGELLALVFVCNCRLIFWPAAASEKQTQMAGGGHAMHGHVSASANMRQQGVGSGVSQGLADPNEAAGSARCRMASSSNRLVCCSLFFPAADLVVRVVTALGLHKVLIRSSIFFLLQALGASSHRVCNSFVISTPSRARALTRLSFRMKPCARS